MSAAEIIEQLNKLPPEEVRVVQEFFSQHSAHSRDHEARTATEEKFHAAANDVFKRFDGLLRRLAK